MTNIVWFRQDLRTSDNPALAHAAAKGAVTPLYVLDDTTTRLPGSASRWWLHHSLKSLEEALGGLFLLRGDPLKVVPRFAQNVGASGVFWNRCYEPSAISRDTALKAQLSEQGFDVQSFNSALLFEPWQIKTGSGGPYKVYSPFWRACLKKDVARPAAASKIDISAPAEFGEQLTDWQLLPTKPNWAKGFEAEWQPGETGAQHKLHSFLSERLRGYRELRDRPDLPNVSCLSPHLHFGEISPRQVWQSTTMMMENDPSTEPDAAKFLAEIGWREFAHHLLFHFPDMVEKNWQPAFDAYQWVDDKKHLAAWQQGRTGYPIVDAGMRQLWTTGYMHNRVRMVVASFLIKHLRIDWRQGETWFWDTLVDANLANNVAGWQWVAGSGADAAPYFRIFNPMTQGRKFDPNGTYVRQWCPELARLPDKYIHAPFEAPAEILAAADVQLGKTYPNPMVDHGEARAAALAGYEDVKQAKT